MEVRFFNSNLFLNRFFFFGSLLYYIVAMIFKFSKEFLDLIKKYFLLYFWEKFMTEFANKKWRKGEKRTVRGVRWMLKNRGVGILDLVQRWWNIGGRRVCEEVRRSESLIVHEGTMESVNLCFWRFKNRGRRLWWCSVNDMSSGLIGKNEICIYCEWILMDKKWCVNGGGGASSRDEGWSRWRKKKGRRRR